MLICCVEGCSKEAKNKKMCWGHYARLRRHGDVNKTKRATPEVNRPEKCSVEGCSLPHYALGYCSAHYTRVRRHGDCDTKLRASNGECLKWIKENTDPETDDCIYWPFARGGGGDAVVFYGRGMMSAPKLMCGIVHGDVDPSLNLECAHSCGNGHLGCMNPKHLRWDTRSGNHADKLIHGTDNRGEKHPFAKISERDAMDVFNSTDSQAKIAARYGISVSAVSAIKRKRLWKHIHASCET